MQEPYVTFDNPPGNGMLLQFLKGWVLSKYPNETLPVSYYLYSFEGALSHKHWNDIGEQTKQDLKAQ